MSPLSADRGHADTFVVTTNVGMLRCPSCGAPAAPDAGRCVYCQSRLATIGCPVCMALLFQGAAFCPSCGAARSRSEQPEPQATRCPACRGNMSWVRIGDVDLLECSNCDGTWIETDAFERLCAEREHQAAVLRRKPTGMASTTSAAKDRVRYRPCPQCKKMMNRLNFGRLSGAIIDVCRQHGTFLDRGELHQVIQFILDGGLDRTRQAEVANLKEEQQRLRELLAQLSRSREG